MKKNVAENVIYASVTVALCLIISIFGGLTSRNKRNDRLAAMNIKGLSIALNIYAEKHGGVFPQSGEVAGGSVPDSLIGPGMLKKYPPNPFSSNGLPIKTAGSDSMSPGDFFYERNEDKGFEYRLIGFGADGVVFEESFID
ncbi:MAG TPA: hypothetical protein PLK80_03025 [bacterium]|nr:hypothetical protein [bacterium]HPN93673.1 hypothetical protein [bacterium]